ncbi:flagellin [Superficieibacter sp. HKU1]|uniref:flagellin N-terminal helical domain-containing protein n=1 Tax=Superficieibacter sp. HKU1 TaxID=3031919 RepID=UPI0023E21AE1|nr:flagellin [Superficieibacter sp. HKU1]WES66638.1 flagellin [Superficieibacter sp. HKU1]
MAQVINTNSLSLITQNNINKNQSALSTSIERLSSGLRINSAKDDAAGQAIANRFTSNIKGLTQAARNANDGISLAQTTEGALSEINNNLQRVRELTVQATTGTNSDSDLSSIQDEIKSRLSEIDRVSGQTQFNGVDVLAKDGTMKIQVGANDGQTISIDLKKINSDTLGLDGFNVENNAKVTVGSAIEKLPDGAPVTITKTGLTGSTDALAGGGVLDGKIYKDGDNYYTQSTGGTNAGYYKVTISDTGAATMSGTQTKEAVDPTNATEVTKYSPPGADVTISAGTKTALGADVALVKLSDANGKDLNTYALQDKDGNLYAAEVDSDDGSVSMKVGSYTDSTGAAVTDQPVKLGGKDGITEVVTDASSGKTYKLSNVSGKDLSDKSNDIATEGPTNKPLAALDDAIAMVDKFRSSLGAVQNQLDSAVTNLNNTTTNLSEAQSRIQDADYATEVSNMSKAQIIQQAGNSVLSKANQVPQQILSLLQG